MIVVKAVGNPVPNDTQLIIETLSWFLLRRAMWLLLCFDKFPRTPIEFSFMNLIHDY